MPRYRYLLFEGEMPMSHAADLEGAEVFYILRACDFGWRRGLVRTLQIRDRHGNPVPAPTRRFLVRRCHRSPDLFVRALWRWWMVF